MKKILFVSLHTIHSSLGGVERVTHLLTTELIKRGYSVIYLSLMQSEGIDETAAPQYYFPCTDIDSEENVSFYNAFITQYQIDVVVNQFGGLEQSFLFLEINPVNRCRVKVISVYHNKPLLDYGYFHKYALFPLPDKKYSLLTFVSIIIKVGVFPLWWAYRQRAKRKRIYNLCTFTISHSDIFIVLSEKYISEITEIIGKQVANGKLFAIPNPNTYIANKIEYQNKQNIILYVGSLNPTQKRPDLLLKVWRKLYKKYPDWELFILGSGSKEVTNSLKKIVEIHHLPRVSFMGNIDPLPYYQVASILALPSIYEGFPMVVTEAMTHGVVPIFFDSFGAAREIVEPDKSGILVKPFSINEFAKKTSKLMHDKTLLNNMAKNATCHIQQFDMQNIIPKWVQLIENM